MLRALDRETYRRLLTPWTPAREVPHTDTTLGRPIQATSAKYEPGRAPGLSLVGAFASNQASSRSPSRSHGFVASGAANGALRALASG